MSDDRARRAYRVFDAALEREGDAREAFVLESCGDDPALLAEVRALLLTDAAAELRTAELRGRTLHRIDVDLVGRVLGPFRLVERIGGGGMGVVYRAERTDGIAQRVAVKIVRQELRDAMSRARFDIERTSLARLEHPAIARLIDAGITDDLPWYVMEYVEGVPIDRYCEQRALTLEQRLLLLIEVCGAVDAAHRALIVHRDIKPGNVLVTSDGQPKLIDFGIAKHVGEAVDAGLTRETGALFTAHYAAPEQVAGREIGTTADVFSLGALAYRLITGKRIYADEVHSDVEYLLAVTQRDVALASRVSGVRALRGDVDEILRKALARDPRERYASAAELGAEFRRHLDHLPVRAQPPNVGYRLRKFAQRHRAAVALGGLLAVASVAGLAIYVAQAREVAVQRDAARREAERAQREAERSTRINEFLTAMLQSADPRLGARDVTVARVLDEAIPRVEATLGGTPDSAAAVLATIARSNESAARFAESLAAYDRALDYAQRVPDGDVEAALLLAERALVLGRLSRNAEGIDAARAALTTLERLAPESTALARAREALGLLLADSGLNAEAETLLRSSVDLKRRLGARPMELGSALLAYAHLLAATQRSAEAVAASREALALYEQAYGPDHPYVNDARSGLMGALMVTGAAEEAVEHARAVYARNVRVLGAEHVDTLWVRANLANALLNSKRPLDAVPEAEAAARGLTRVAGAGNQVTLYARSVYVSALCAAGRPAEGMQFARDVVAQRQQLFGTEHYLTASARANVGICLLALARLREAEPELLAAAATLERVSGPGYARTQDTYRELTRLYERLGDEALAGVWRAKLQSR